MAFDLSGMKEIASRHGNQFIHDTVNDAAPLVREKGGLKRKKCKGVEIINPRPNSAAGGGIVDGGAFPTNSSLTYEQLAAFLKLYTTKLTLGVGLAEQCQSAADAIDLVKDMYEVGMGQLARTLDRDIMDPTISVVGTGAAISGGSVSLVMADGSGFREGQQYYWSDNGTVNSNPFTVTSVTPNTAGGATVVFSTAATGTVAATDDSLLSYSKAPSTGACVTTLDDLAGTGNVYNQSGAIQGWTGNSRAQGGAYTTAGLNALFAQQGGRGRRPDTVIMSPLAHVKHQDVAVAAGRRYNSTDLDPYGKQDNATFAGARILENPNAPNLKIYAYHSEALKLGVWKDFHSLSNSGKQVDVAESNAQYIIRVAGMFEVIAHQRKEISKLTGLTY